jgi:hypothetical protein
MAMDDVARAALSLPGIESAAIFVKNHAAATLDLAAAAGVEGAALSGLVAAVQQAEHPIAKALTDPAATFDVQPMNPGGPALRSHLPFGDGSGVLAVAHDAVLSPDVKRSLEGLAHAAAAALHAGD